MNEASITQYITEVFPGVETATNFGYTFFSTAPSGSFRSPPSPPPIMSMIASQISIDRESFA